MHYLRPTDLDAALTALQGEKYTVLAGGTDLYPAHAERPFAGPVLDLTAIDGLDRIDEADDGVRVGAGVTWTQLIEADLPPQFDGLKQAARQVGGVQIQNRATLVGNLCNASPAADGVPPLLTLDARVEIAAASGTETLDLADFIQGNRRTALRPDQLVTAVIVPKPKAARAVSGFSKLGARSHLVISIASAAAVLQAAEAGRIVAARVAIGACGPVPLRLLALEQVLVGKDLARGLGDLAQPEHLADLAPIDDVRASAAYRRDAALSLTRRLLSELGGLG